MRFYDVLSLKKYNGHVVQSDTLGIQVFESESQEFIPVE